MAASLSALQQLAQLHGIQSSYVNMARRRVHSTPDSILATLRALGIDVQRLNDCPDALRAERAHRARQPLEPVTLAWDGRRRSIPCSLPAAALQQPALLSLHLEQNQSIRRSLDLTRLPRSSTRTIDGTTFFSCQIPLPPALPAGYHKLTLETATTTCHSLVLSAPVRSFAPEHQDRSWGVFAPLYALRSARNWGAGDYSDLASFARWIGDNGGKVAATLPLLPLFLDNPFDPSPYSPISRLFWSEFHLDLERVPELETSLTSRHRAKINQQVVCLRAQPLVDYRAILAFKRSLLLPCARRFFRSQSARRDAFERFRTRHPHLDSYASFRTLQETLHPDWHHWPKPLRTGLPPDRIPNAPIRQYHLFTQWLAHEQLRRAASTATQRDVQLYLDLPLGAHPSGYDTWRFQSSFAQAATGGAPPDPVFTHGQNWGFTPLHPTLLRQSGYSYLIDCLRHHLHFARILRFDHVMALHRLYWIPRGLPSSAGTYVTYPADELYAVLSIESHRHKARIVGENLGTVPPEVNRALSRHRVRGMHVVQYELRPDPRLPLPPAPRASVASLNTHDMPPFAAYWHDLDIFDRFELGLLHLSCVNSEQRRRRRTRESLQRFLRRLRRQQHGFTQTSDVALALLAHLRAGRAELLLLNLEDVWLETRPQNTPGTTSERINWQHKTRFPIESWQRLSPMRLILDTLNHTTPRASQSTVTKPRPSPQPPRKLPKPIA